jgi:hypothetical protein
MKQTNTITLYGTVSNNASSCVCKNGRNYACFEISVIPEPGKRAIQYNVVAFGKQGD